MWEVCELKDPKILMTSIEPDEDYDTNWRKLVAVNIIKNSLDPEIQKKVLCDGFETQAGALLWRIRYMYTDDESSGK